MQIERIGHFTGHKNAVYCIITTGNDSFLSGSGDHYVVKWNVKNDKEGILLSTMPAGVYCFLHSDKMLYAGCGNGEVHTISLENNSDTLKAPVHKHYVFDIVQHQQQIYSAGGDGSVVKMNLKLEVETSVHLGNFKIRSMVMNTKYNQLVAGCGDGSIKLMHSDTLQLQRSIQAHRENFSVNTLCISPDNKYLITGSRDAMLEVFDIADDFRKVESIAAHNYAIYKMAFNPSGKILATASRDRKIKLWSADLKFIARIDDALDGHKYSVNTLCWLSDSVLLTAGDDKSIMAWKISD
ncbi:MAG: hypothetical protein JSS90_06135 [Bacteroidetes bacterium]|nr:hypothetical protein [Bacteroidota bacterium]